MKVIDAGSARVSRIRPVLDGKVSVLTCYVRRRSPSTLLRRWVPEPWHSVGCSPPDRSLRLPGKPVDCAGGGQQSMDLGAGSVLSLPRRVISLESAEDRGACVRPRKGEGCGAERRAGLKPPEGAAVACGAVSQFRRGEETGCPLTP